ncbi:NUDIX hydrolase [Metabacillus litoralis]|uniref:NUDIX hydrolase n=1 Tax=Metabacillus litoralis TaxID=152268 RepID=UPI001CFE182A|nr:NUDIX hydrolase [Metabacillus litoralis]
MNHKNIILVVSTTIFKEGKILMIQESKPEAFNKWNFPSGRIEYGEDIQKAALREVKEETGYDVKLINTTGVYNFKSHTNNQIILFHYSAELSGGSLSLERNEIKDYKWLKLEELLELEENDLREKDVVLQIIKNLQDGNVYPIRLFNEQILGN